MFKRSSIEILAVLVALLASATAWAVAAPSPDAIAIRVMPNLKHVSAARWYAEQNFRGAPQALTVDGYEAIRDGRTVYVNVANVKDNDSNAILSLNDDLYTNIFIISYNQDAERATEDIFGQILSNWKFNSNILTAGQCSQTGVTACLYGSSCPAGEYCQSSHDTAVRDTRRLADLYELNLLLKDYQAQHDGKCPGLGSGTYLPNKSISTWPSWQETLGRALGAVLPFDPINRMGACPGYNPATCWDEQTKQFADPTPADNSFDLPSGSLAYAYLSSPDGKQCEFLAPTEAGLDCKNDGSCRVGNGLGVPAELAAADPGAGATNTPPRIAGLNFLPAIRNYAYQGFIQADDADRDPLNWSLALDGNWTGWTPPTLEKTPVPYQHRFFSPKAGPLGDYKFTVTVDDGRGGVASTSVTVKVVNYCVDQDGDGYGTCPNCGRSKGCAMDGNDCDDTPGVHPKTGTMGTYMINGNQINPGQPDNCTQFDGLDNNCDGSADNKADTSSVLSNIDFETINPLTGFPEKWSAGGQARSSVKVTTDQARSGSRSVVLHQDGNISYPGKCSQAYCASTDYLHSSSCNWDAGANQCTFNSYDTCHASAPFSDYDTGENFCWGHSNTVDFAYLGYDVSNLAFLPGELYIIRYYYKGDFDFGGTMYSSMGYSLGWHSQCAAKSSYAWKPCDSWTAFSADCPNNSAYCCMHVNSTAAQKDCYSSVGFGGIAAGNYQDWVAYTKSFVYTDGLAAVKDDAGNLRHQFGLAIGYNNTPAAGNDVYIDDFQLIKCVNK